MSRSKIIKVIVFCAIIVCTTLLAYVMNERFGFADEKPLYNITKPTTNNIVLIGDSWAAYAHDRGFDEYLSAKTNMEVKSKGFPGYKSKDIYNLLFVEGNDGLKDIVKTNPKYVVLVCGINDIHGQYGPKYYAYHTSMIINTLMRYGIEVIYLEIPKWNIADQYRYYSFMIKAAYRLSFVVETRHWNIADAIDIYRSEFEKQLPSLERGGHFYYLKSDFLNNGKYWSDDMHLNKDGYKCLADSLVSATRQQVEE